MSKMHIKLIAAAGLITSSLVGVNAAPAIAQDNQAECPAGTMPVMLYVCDPVTLRCRYDKTICE